MSSRGQRQALLDELVACRALLVEARAALSLIRETVEDLAPPGSVPNDEYLTPEFSVEAAAIVTGIYAIAGRGS